MAASVLLAAALGAACSEPPSAPDRPIGVPVEVEAARYGSIHPTLGLLGTVHPFLAVPLTASLAGRISYPERFRSGLMTGERVAEGESLAFLENEGTRHALAEARLLAEQATAELERDRMSFQAGLLAEAAYAEAQVKERLARERLGSAERDAERLELVTPRAGKLIVNKVVPPGAEIAAGTVLATLAAAGPARVEAWAAAADRSVLRPGLSVRLAAPGQAEPTGAGRIREVAAVVDPTGTVRIVVDVTDPAGLPAPGEGVEMTVELEKRAEVLTLPDQALVVGGGGHAVFLVGPSLEGDRAARTPVEIGRRGGGRVEVLRGIREGDRVIVSGVALLSDGALVTEVKVERAAEDPAQSSTAATDASSAH